jgi:protein SCO1/2
MRHWIFVILALAVAGSAAVWYVESRAPVEAPAQTGLLATPSTTIGGPFHLTDQTGKAVTEKTYAGKYLLIYFGYTFCPDACPTELLIIGQALDQMDKVKSDKIQPIFITIDPARDTQQKMAEYVPSFYPRLVGLTGSDADIAEVAKEYKVYYAKSEASQNATDYVMDHSSYVYLVNPQGQTIGIFSSDTSADDLAKALGTAVK